MVSLLVPRLPPPSSASKRKNEVEAFPPTPSPIRVATAAFWVVAAAVFAGFAAAAPSQIAPEVVVIVVLPITHHAVVERAGLSSFALFSPPYRHRRGPFQLLLLLLLQLLSSFVIALSHSSRGTPSTCARGTTRPAEGSASFHYYQHPFFSLHISILDFAKALAGYCYMKNEVPSGDAELVNVLTSSIGPYLAKKGPHSVFHDVYKYPSPPSQ